ncbi:molybdopterin molybdotransferase MoeA [Corynebacterium cystitidis]|uniref:molybdopterin molybdotransferase MoeA n=1 Tax=Corynebacterium cystitidis TaxID=35757 RepID=UPI00211F1397|nr:molybdopterin molybdotransferase MoeA [Corynebacterium cystitidis]
MSRTPEQHLVAVQKLVGTRPTAALPLVEAARAKAVTAADVAAQFDSPRFDNSQMDGYALSVEHVAATPGQFRVGATIPAGTDPDVVYPEGITNAIVPIMTGAKVPHGTAAIVPVEHCTPGIFAEEGEFIQVPPTPHGQFVRQRGSDIQAGATIVPAGTTVTAPVVATLSSQSITEVEVMRPARLVTVTGGAEIGAEIGTAGTSDSGAAVIPDANAPLMQVMAHHHGMEVVGHVRTNDDPAALRRDLEQAVATYSPDAIVTSGGISAGKFEVIRQVLEPAGWFGHVDQQPGGPQGLSTINSTPVICLPGNPVSTLVSFRLYVAPVLGQAPQPVEAVLTEEVTGLAGRDQFLRGQLRLEGAQVHATPVGGAGSHLISQAVPADCLIRVPMASTIQAGGHVMVYEL